MIVYIDTEVSFTQGIVTDYGAIREDGAVLHTKSTSEFNAFVSVCDTWCGHNIVRHDLNYINKSVATGHIIIDTLYLSPLLFPKKPYHHLVKDDKLQTDELNNPVNDAKKACELLHDELAAWDNLDPKRKSIYYHLLKGTKEFGGFFEYLKNDYSKGRQLIFADVRESIASLILAEYSGKLCQNTNIELLASQYPIELAYSLAVIGADDLMSMTPAWVMKTYPKVANMMNHLRNRPCGRCEYCRQRLDAHVGLKEFFGYDRFRMFEGVPMQQQAVESAIRGESLLTIFPTGGGKSLTFQLPALMAGRNAHALTVVISPLQSLMKDQVDNLMERGISDAVTINGLLDPIERAEAINQVSSGAANLLYIAPEMLRSATIERLLMGRNIARFVIDEAHCFSAWGHDFRVDYLFIGDFLRDLQKKKNLRKPIPVSCFTATAKQKVITDIHDYFQQKLGIDLRIFAASSERKNLRYSVIHADTDNDKYNQLRNLILGHNCPSIVYVSRTKRTRVISNHLNNDGISALPFNGKMEAADKVKNQDAFMRGEVQVIVATSAFGMGVDKKDVGLVVHFDISDSLENYIQEAGRAGRDPQMEASCYVLFSDSDLDKHFILLNQTKLSISDIQQVWKAIKELTPTRTKISCSPLEIARQAGWSEEGNDMETRVKAAIAALENAGYIHRGNNAPKVFATGICVGNMDEARHRLNLSPYFDSQTREEAARIIRSLISARASAKGQSGEAESRVDYLADILGMTKESVIRNINLMRQDGLLADTLDMQAWIEKSSTARDLEQLLKLEQFVLKSISNHHCTINYKELNETAQNAGIAISTVKRIKNLLYFLTIKNYILKEEHTVTGSAVVQLVNDKATIEKQFEQRSQICRFIVKTLTAEAQRTAVKEETKKPSSHNTLVNFSVIELMHRFTSSVNELSFDSNREVTLDQFEEALLYLSKTSLLKLEGGFLVIYNTLQLDRVADRGARYGKEQYRMLDEFYKQRIRQIHIVGEYANLMVKDYDAALQFVNDYFNMDFRKFIQKYFKGERKNEINNNITPDKYKHIFGQLDEKQLEIINDKQSKYIVVAAGPGSGKTRVLVHKLASLLLLEDVKHEQLLMLTFSRSAATEFKKRLIELIGNAAHFVEIKTFHSYSFDLLGKQGSLSEAKDIVGQAAKMIENGEVEISKIAKSVLVIDEAQDMGEDDFRLLTALMKKNEEMRVIAVGDDDQNIYKFRGSDSKYLKSLITEHGATLYEMTTNYRSTQLIVDFSNAFAKRIPNRMKESPCLAFSKDYGTVELHHYDAHDFLIDVANRVAEQKGTEKSTCILTTTNEEAMQIAYLLQEKGLHTRLIQSMGGFRFYHLAEVRYFLKQFSSIDQITLTWTQWNEAKKRTLQQYKDSTCLNAMRSFFSDYETTHRAIYLSDLKEYLLESDIEDFITADCQTIFISTIHKAKGREFDIVHLIASSSQLTEETLRAYYVGITRAKQQLYVHTDSNMFYGSVPPIAHHVTTSEHIPLSVPLTHRDVFLDFFKERKTIVLRLRSGDALQYRNGYLFTQNGECVAALSKSKEAEIKKLSEKGYQVTSAVVSFIVAWKPKNSILSREVPQEQEYAICLANLYLEHKT